LKRKDSVPVWTMWERKVRRSTAALQPTSLEADDQERLGKLLDRCPELNARAVWLGEHLTRAVAGAPAQPPPAAAGGSTKTSTGLSGRSTWKGALASSQTSLHLVKFK